MVEYSNETELSDLLKALCDETRRSLMTYLCQQGPTRVTDLANRYEMSLNAISKHIKVLERSGLIIRKKLGRNHWIEADLSKMASMEIWLNSLKSIWQLRLDKLEHLVNKGEM